jgi:hypothetical protein
MMNKIWFLTFSMALLTPSGLYNAYAQSTKSVFAKDNLTAWCIVPFDAKHRSPEARASMLDRLGFKTLAYDWRDEHIPEFDDEIVQLKKHGIAITAFWWGGGLPLSKEDIITSERIQMQLDFFKRNNLHPEVWITCSDHDLKSKSDEGKFNELAARVDIFAQALKDIGCRLGLYNHGHEHLERMPAAFEEMLPYLFCVNLNGMNKNGPIGIIGHIAEEDVEVVLERNLEGLEKLLVEIGDTEALKTYQ